jgi:hypothetical protein
MRAYGATTRNGHGALTFTDGTRWDGLWRDGKLNGPGAETLNDGTRCEGQFLDNRLTGICTSRDGFQFEMRAGRVLR